MRSKKTVAILHYRVGGLDGVSLEISKRKKILEKLGYKVVLISGPNQQGADYVIPYLKIPSNLGNLEKESLDLGRELSFIQEKEKIALWFVHNVFSLGRHPLAAREITAYFDNHPQPVIAVNHDFYWERPDFFNNLSPKVKKKIIAWHLPQRNYLKHVVINSLAAKELMIRKQIKARIMPDVFDFSQVLGDKKHAAEIKKKLAIDKFLVILQATRIVPRKGIELGLRFAWFLQKAINQPVVFLLSNQPDLVVSQSVEYYRKLKEYAKHLGIRLINCHHLFGQKYSFWDYYHLADIISYPSLLEGYGNQFLEAMFFKKPVLIFEYPVFIRDIKPKGYRVISLGRHYFRKPSGLVTVSDEWFEKAVKEYLFWRGKRKIKEAVEVNFNLARKHNSIKVLEKHLKEIVTRV